MERLTEKHYLGTDHYMKCSGNCNVDMDCIDCPSFDRLVERLAAYEDTGLEPEEVTALQKDWSDLCTVIGECGGIDRLRELAAADVAPVVHGRWETNSDRPDTLICSMCKCGFDMWKHDPHNYCPNCGAKMDGAQTTMGNMAMVPKDECGVVSGG